MIVNNDHNYAKSCNDNSVCVYEAHYFQNKSNLPLFAANTFHLLRTTHQMNVSSHKPRTYKTNNQYMVLGHYSTKLGTLRVKVGNESTHRQKHIIQSLLDVP